MLAVFGGKFNATYPVALGPGIPTDRINILQEAFDKVVRDPEFLAQIKRLYLAPGNVSGETIAKIIERVDAAKPDVIDGLKRALAYQ
jgi:tripartite-type tricarboxylate transporter receptor subunit TctC